MLKKENYTNTIIVCCLGYIVQAVVNNFAPLLFVMFKNTYNISFEKIAVLASFNFGIQLIMDLLSSKFIPKIGYRATVVSADIFSVLGLLGLAFLPDVMPDPYVDFLSPLCFMQSAEDFWRLLSALLLRLARQSVSLQ